jgi:hypothetical protein
MRSVSLARSGARAMASGGDTPSAPRGADDADAVGLLGVPVGAGAVGARVPSMASMPLPVADSTFSDHTFSSSLLLSVDLLVEVPEDSELTLSYKKKCVCVCV